jgi:hypothetical protein
MCLLRSVRAEYAFRHTLIRTVAYESQLKADRAGLHRRLARAIRVREPESADEIAALRRDSNGRPKPAAASRAPSPRVAGDPWPVAGYVPRKQCAAAAAAGYGNPLSPFRLNTSPPTPPAPAPPSVVPAPPLPRLPPSPIPTALPPGPPTPPLTFVPPPPSPPAPPAPPPQTTSPTSDLARTEDSGLPLSHMR